MTRTETQKYRFFSKPNFCLFSQQRFLDTSMAWQTIQRRPLNLIFMTVGGFFLTAGVDTHFFSILENEALNEKHPRLRLQVEREREWE